MMNDIFTLLTCSKIRLNGESNADSNNVPIPPLYRLVSTGNVSITLLFGFLQKYDNSGVILEQSVLMTTSNNLHESCKWHLDLHTSIRRGYVSTV
jgi:hypothetical protein